MIIKRGLSDFPGMTIVPDRYAEAAMNDEPIRAPKWRNLWLLKDGRALTGKGLWKDEEEARERGQYDFDRITELLAHGFESRRRYLDGECWDSEISHFIPMPVLK